SVAQLDVAVSVRALARESGIHRKCLANWKRAADFLKEVHSARKRMHGRGRASWYRPMEIKVYERLLDWRRKGTAVSVGRLQEWSREFMKLLYPLVEWKGSQRWSDRCRRAMQEVMAIRPWQASGAWHRDDVDYQCRPDAAVAGDARHHYRRSNRCSVGAHQERGVPEGARDRDVGVHGGRDEVEAVGFFLAEDRAERGVPTG
ncbi:unnamed protein product, partial [Closterium sp. NIES-53]